MMSNVSNFRRKVRIERTMFYVWKFLLYLIPIVILIVVGVLSLSAIANPA